MKEIVFLLEEESAKAMIQGILPKLSAGTVISRYIVFEGKQDMEKQLAGKLKRYNNPEAVFIILRDQDSSDCLPVKEELRKKCHEAGKADAVVRIACRELESWYLADLQAVAKAFSKPGIMAKQEEKKYRNPDMLGCPSGELRTIIPEYQKINGSRLISHYLDLNNTRSKSFYHFIRSIKAVLDNVHKTF